MIARHQSHQALPANARPLASSSAETSGSWPSSGGGTPGPGGTARPPASRANNAKAGACSTPAANRHDPDPARCMTAECVTAPAEIVMSPNDADRAAANGRLFGAYAQVRACWPNKVRRLASGQQLQGTPGRSSVERLVLGGVCGDHVEARVGGELGDQRLVSADPSPVWIDVAGDAPGVIGGPDERRF